MRTKEEGLRVRMRLGLERDSRRENRLERAGLRKILIGMCVS